MIARISRTGGRLVAFRTLLESGSAGARRDKKHQTRSSPGRDSEYMSISGVQPMGLMTSPLKAVCR